MPGSCCQLDWPGGTPRRKGIDGPHAFELVRRLARSSERELVEVASDLIDRPPERV